jgi:hypothetical protein
LFWPLLSSFMRLVIAIGLGWLAFRLTGSLSALFASLALGLIVYGVSLALAIRAGVWFERDQRPRLARASAPAHRR